MNIELVKYNKGVDGNLNVPVSINEQETEQWLIIYDTGCGVGQSFSTKEDAMEWAAEMVLPNTTNLVRIKVSVKQYGRI